LAILGKQGKKKWRFFKLIQSLLPEKLMILNETTGSQQNTRITAAMAIKRRREESGENITEHPLMKRMKKLLGEDGRLNGELAFAEVADYLKDHQSSSSESSYSSDDDSL
jgi:hypothetical protein